MTQRNKALAVVETHPVQYHAPVYRALQAQFGVAVTAIYGSDFSVAGYHDEEFGATFAWDSDLLSGYRSIFLERVGDGGARSVNRVSSKGLARELGQVNPEAILLVGYSPRFYQHALWWAWRSGYPLLFRGETTDHAVTRGPIKQWLRDQCLGWFYRQCQALLFVGQRSLTHYRRLQVPETRLVFSPYCVDTAVLQTGEDARQRLRQQGRQALDLPEEWLVLLFCGKLSPRKGPDLLVQAVKLLPEAVHGRVAVLFVGDGELRGALVELAQAEPVIRVRFAGFQNQSSLSQFYQAADLLVLPSRGGETWGLVVNEALHHGIPCVVSEAVGAAPDLVAPGCTGEIFRSGSAADLAQALERALLLVGRPEIRQGCRQKVSGYTVEKAAEGIAHAYRMVVEGQSLPRAARGQQVT